MVSGGLTAHICEAALGILHTWMEDPACLPLRLLGNGPASSKPECQKCCSSGGRAQDTRMTTLELWAGQQAQERAPGTAQTHSRHNSQKQTRACAPSLLQTRHVEVRAIPRATRRSSRLSTQNARQTPRGSPKPPKIPDVNRTAKCSVTSASQPQLTTPAAPRSLRSPGSRPHASESGLHPQDL